MSMQSRRDALKLMGAAALGAAMPVGDMARAQAPTLMMDGMYKIILTKVIRIEESFVQYWILKPNLPGNNRSGCFTIHGS